MPSIRGSLHFDVIELEGDRHLRVSGPCEARNERDDLLVRSLRVE